MREVEATAPAKLLLAGEYAVLSGAPALVLAVDRRARVRLAPREDGAWRLVLRSGSTTSVDLRPGTRGGLVDRQGRPATEEPSLRLVALALERTRREHPDLPPLEVEVDTRALHRDGAKLGLGSSAAVAVALGGALRRITDGGDPHATNALVEDLALHRDAQGGGSGVDVAASFHGGLLAYRLGAGGAAPVVERLAWPPGLGWLALSTGRPVRTSDLVRQVEGFLRREPEAGRARMDAVGDAAEAALAAVRAGRVPDLLAALDGCREALDALGRASGADIVSAPHAALARLAAEAGAVYKPSGAGGGDVGIALAARQDVLSGLARRSLPAGCVALDLALDPDGLRLSDPPEHGTA